MGLIPYWAGLVKPREVEHIEWLQDDAGDEDEVERGWSQSLEEDGASSPLYLLWSQPLYPQEISHDAILIPVVMVSVDGAFGGW